MFLFSFWLERSMEIKIDTQNDSKEHIEHMIAFLQKVIASQGGASSGAAAPGMFGMFSETSSPAAQPTSDAQPGMFGMFDDSSADDPSTPEDDDASETEKIELIPY